jgi:hypothetical protein
VMVGAAFPVLCPGVLTTPASVAGGARPTRPVQFIAQAHPPPWMPLIIPRKKRRKHRRVTWSMGSQPAAPACPSHQRLPSLARFAGPAFPLFQCPLASRVRRGVGTAGGTFPFAPRGSLVVREREGEGRACPVQFLPWLALLAARGGCPPAFPPTPSAHCCRRGLVPPHRARLRFYSLDLPTRLCHYPDPVARYFSFIRAPWPSVFQSPCLPFTTCCPHLEARNHKPALTETARPPHRAPPPPPTRRDRRLSLAPDLRPFGLARGTF